MICRCLPSAHLAFKSLLLYIGFGEHLHGLSPWSGIIGKLSVRFSFFGLSVQFLLYTGDFRENQSDKKIKINFMQLDKTLPSLSSFAMLIKCQSRGLKEPDNFTFNL